LEYWNVGKLEYMAPEWIKPNRRNIPKIHYSTIPDQSRAIVNKRI
jgi:hypothetical protein